ncbi:MAG: helix-turn-helix domain-containing protein [Pirellulaceae bacterium]
MSTTETQKVFLTVADVAERWGCTRIKVNRAIQAGVLPAFDSNVMPVVQRRRWLIRIDDLLAFEEARASFARRTAAS